MKVSAASPSLALQITPVPLGWQWNVEVATDSVLFSKYWELSLEGR